jgi:NAD(P)-dependent dehydrogenase (short-subunit alcohol dehydrogenase family)
MARTILITGCSSGIGLDAARTLRGRGWRVFATCRQERDCERLRGEGLESFRLDYADEASVAAAVAEAEARAGGALDAVFNNGAYALPGATEDLPRDGLRAIFETNLFGPFDVIRRAMPAMLRAGRGRIVNCSSVLGFAALRYRGAYIATKHAMEGLTDTLRLENRGGPVKIVLIEPGPIRTDIRVKSVPHFERWIDWQNSAKRAEYEGKVRPRLYAKDPTPDAFELAPAAVTAKLIRALESPRPRARYYVTTPTYVAALIDRLPTALSDRMFGRG